MTDPWDLQAEADRIRRTNGAPRPELLAAPDEWPTIHPDAWHGLAGDIALGLQDWSEADPIAVLVSVLTGFGNMVGGIPHVIAGFSDHPARIFACLVGDTAKARKGTSWATARTVLRLADPDWVDHRTVTGLSTGEGLIGAVRDPDIGENGEPILNTGVKDKRLLAVEEEFARVLAVSKRDANTLPAIIRSAYDTGHLNVLTKTATTATGAHISLLGHITVEELRSKLAATDIANGFANRFLWVLVRRPVLICDPKRAPLSLLTPWGSALAQAKGAARNIRELDRTGTAADYWETIYRTMAADTPPGITGQLAARPETHVLRLAVTYALLDSSDKITEQHLAAAWAVWCYTRKSIDLIFGDQPMAYSTEGTKLLEAIRDAGDQGLTFTAQSEVFNRNFNAATLERIRLELEDEIVTQLSPPTVAAG